MPMLISCPKARAKPDSANVAIGATVARKNPRREISRAAPRESDSVSAALIESFVAFIQIIRGASRRRQSSLGALFVAQQRKAIQCIAGADHQILPAPEHIGHRAVAELRRHSEVPQNPAAGWIECNQITGRVATKQQLACSGKNSRAAQSARAFGVILMAPAN